ncbi:MAG: PhnD/SsuA/transferrin family substrate-binding protein [Alphaproteobacteria bacterium]|nr:PhnD/SsuA/transferrin family substrate-binding protein [Alphaproteobacteria bacterium]
MRPASLPMYDPPELHEATDAWWQGLARHFRAAGVADAPDRLTRPADLHAHWRDKALLFSQGCGYPLTHEFAGHWQVIATPCYAAPGCDGAAYRSVLIVPAESALWSLDQLRGCTACYNSEDSHSGFNVLRATFAPLARDGRFFGKVVRSFGHIKSAALVQESEVDVASLDCVTHALFARHAPHRLAGTRVLHETEPAPGLPYVTSAATDPQTLARLRAGLTAALGDPALEDVRERLLIAGARQLPDTAYRVIPRFAERAAGWGYPRLN